MKSDSMSLKGILLSAVAGIFYFSVFVLVKLGTERFGRQAQTRRMSLCRHEVIFGPKPLLRRYSGFLTDFQQTVENSFPLSSL